MILTAFLLGLLGSTHCVGMCGPLALALPSFSLQDQLQMFLSSLIYNLGRVFSYAFLGLLFGLIGSSLAINGFQQVIATILAILLLALALFSINFEERVLRFKIFNQFYQVIQNQIRQQFRKSGLGPYFLIGFFNGFLPCGMVYVAIAGSVVVGNVLEGILFMIFFGLGTLPLMLLVAFSRKLIPRNIKRALRRFSPVVMIGFAIMILLRVIMIELPFELDFWEMIQQPVMCH